MDAVTCKTLRDKMTWAMGLINPGSKNDSLEECHLTLFIRLLDLVENNGFMNGPTEEELDELIFRKRPDELNPLPNKLD